MFSKRAPGQRPKKRKENRLYGNQHQTHLEGSVTESASSKKLKSDDSYFDFIDNNDFGYCIFDKTLPVTIYSIRTMRML